MYRAVNARFADAVCDEVADESPLVLVQDYHFALAPQMIRERLPLSTIIAFWHIPWPNPRDFATCPWGRQLLKGLLGSSIVGFQTPDDCRNFVDTVECFARRAHRPRARRHHLRGPPDEGSRLSGVGRVAESLGQPIAFDRGLPRGHPTQLHLPPDVRLGVGVDRLDYTKGIDEKFLAVERLLESPPGTRGALRIRPDCRAEPRQCLPAYRELRSQLLETADRINARFGTSGYRPIILLEAHHEPAEVYRFLRAADLCYVGSLHDGMNLVAKEFVSARDDDRGVLILSQFAGAARELTGALIVNPLRDRPVGARACRGVEHGGRGTVAAACAPCAPSSPSSTRTDGPERCWRMQRVCARVRHTCMRMIRSAGQPPCTPDDALCIVDSLIDVRDSPAAGKAKCARIKCGWPIPQRRLSYCLYQQLISSNTLLR